MDCSPLASPSMGFSRQEYWSGVPLPSPQLLSYVQLFATTWTAACQASLSITNSRNLLKLMSIELVMPSNHLILFHPLLLPPSILPSIRVLFSSLHQVAKVLEFQLQRQSFQWILEIIHVFLSVFLSCWRNEISSSFLPSPISPFPSFLLSSALSFLKKKKISFCYQNKYILLLLETTQNHWSPKQNQWIYVIWHVTDGTTTRLSVITTGHAVALRAFHIPRNTEKYFLLKLGVNSAFCVHFYILYKIISHMSYI